MLYYIPFWAILGFIFHFYIIFGTNLLTGGPSQICCFMPISVFRRKGISNGVETERNQLEKLFLEGNTPDGLGPYSKKFPRRSRGWRARPLGAPPCLVGPSELHRRAPFAYISPYTLKTSGSKIDREFRCQKPP